MQRLVVCGCYSGVLVDPRTPSVWVLDWCFGLSKDTECVGARGVFWFIQGLVVCAARGVFWFIQGLVVCGC